MNNEAISEGDVVQLKSGGPNMTISEVTEQYAVCTWFAKVEVKESTFKLSMLEKYNPDDLSAFP